MSALYTGHVIHQRVGAKPHGFRYPMYMLLLDLAELPALDRRLRLFGHNRARPVTLRDRDHLRDPAKPLIQNVRDELAASGVPWPGGPVRLLTHCRVFGYVFNPVSFFFCCEPHGRLAAIVAEVNNTFGERHCYVLGGSTERPVDALSIADEPLRRWHVKKVFHVSPFKSLDGTYEFLVAPPAPEQSGRIDVQTRLHVGPELRFASRLRLERRALTDRTIAGALLRYPLMTAQVIGGIHFEALRLWLKGIPYRSKPPYDPAAARRETLM